MVDEEFTARLEAIRCGFVHSSEECWVVSMVGESLTFRRAHIKWLWQSSLQ